MAASNKSQIEELKAYFESIRIKNEDSQTKLIVTISWAASAFILGTNIINNFSSCQKWFFFIMFLFFSASLLSEFFASILLAKCASLDSKGDIKADLFDVRGRFFMRARNILFLIGFLMLPITAYFIVKP